MIREAVLVLSLLRLVDEVRRDLLRHLLGLAARERSLTSLDQLDVVTVLESERCVDLPIVARLVRDVAVPGHLLPEELTALGLELVGVPAEQRVAHDPEIRAADLLQAILVEDTMDGGGDVVGPQLRMRLNLPLSLSAGREQRGDDENDDDETDDDVGGHGGLPFLLGRGVNNCKLVSL